jgi:hypothetical protein
MRSQDLRVVDSRIRMHQRGTETHRAVVVEVHGATCTVRLLGALLTANNAGLAVVVGSVVEVHRPRGVGGGLQVRAVLR